MGRTGRFAVVILAGLGSVVASESREPEPVAGQLRSLSKRHGIGVEAATGPGLIPSPKAGPPGPVLTWSAAGEEEYRAYAPIFAGALDKYPPGLIRASGLRKVVWCADLAGPGVARRTSGVYSPDEGTIYLDVRVGKTTAGGRRYAVHHEIFHAIDHRRDRTFGDAAWEAINGPRAYFARRHPEPDAPGPALPIVEPPDLGVLETRAGFMTTYARSEVREDKAELFACMMALPLFVESRMADDTRLAAKVRRIEALLQAQCPGLPADFWASPIRR